MPNVLRRIGLSTRAAVAPVVAALGAAGCAADPAVAPSALQDPPAAARVPLATAAAIPPGPYTPGTSYFGRNGYVEYIAGNSPVIFSAPHGGTLAPSEIPDRTAAACGGEATTVRDGGTEEIARAVRAAFFDSTGQYPHVIINRLARRKLDANRALLEAACGDAEAETAYGEFHDFIEVAEARVAADRGKGWYTDLHGHGHAVRRLELGYLLTAADLRLANATLDAGAAYEQKSAFRTFSEQSPLAFSALLRGPTSLGTLLAGAGYASVPSAQDPAPDVGEEYFNGGYNTATHGCRAGGAVCGVQIEAQNAGVRDNATNRTAFARALAGVYKVYLAQNYGIALAPAPAEVVVDNSAANNDPALSRFAASSNWTTATLQADKYLGDYRLTDGDGPTNDGAAFYFYVGLPGTYAVSAWWPDHPSRSTSVSYRVFELDGGALLADLTRNQQTGGGQWNALGTYGFTRVGWAKVLMSRSLSGPGTLAADAIRAVRQ